jgi:hypothetical protein
VAGWKPTIHDPENDTCTPGRIATVFFFPEPSYQILKEKPAGWGVKTNYGWWSKFSE